MYNTIDDYVVVLRFDNEQFEAATKDSMQSLEKLKSSLKMDEAETGFKKITASAKAVNLSGISNGIEAISNKFSALGIAGMTVIQNLTNSAFGMVKKIFTAIPQQIASGGWKRALNLEQAKFQIEGLGKSWEKLSDDINYGVQDTAYGLDAAAKAASQLSASGVEAGDQMKMALRGISGVAAMTNSDYESISSIFTTVAGQGKLMTMQMRQLEARGLNVAASMAKQMNTTEAAVREMVTDGVIDFQTFSYAMDEAFGEHAKAANDTFTGALSNVKSALSRIGADVAEVQLFNFRNVLNSVRPVINNVRYALEPLIIAFNKLSIFASNKLIAGIQKVEKVLQPLADKGKEIKSVWDKEFDGIKNAFKSATDAATEAATDADSATGKIGHAISDAGKVIRVTAEEAQAAWDIWNKGTYGNQPERSKNLEKVGLEYKYVQSYVNELIDKNFDLSKMEITVAEEAEVAGEAVSGAMDSAAEATSGLKKQTEEASTATVVLSSLFNVLKNIAHVMGNAFKTVQTVVTAVWKGIKPYLSSLSRGIFPQISKLSDKVAKLSDKITSKIIGSSEKITKVTSKIVGTIGKAFKTIKSGAGTVFKTIAPYFKTFILTIGTAIGKVAGFIKEHQIFQKVGSAVITILSTLWGVITKIAAGVKDFFKQLFESEGFQHLKEELKLLWERFKEFSVEKINQIKDAVGNLMDKMSKVDLTKPTNLAESLSNLANKIANFLEKLRTGQQPIKSFFESFADKKGPIKILSKLPNLFEGNGTAIENFKSKLQKLKFGNFINNLQELIPTIKEKSINAVDSVKTFFGKFSDTFKKVDWATVEHGVTSCVKIFGSLVLLKGYQNATDGMAGMFKNIGGFFKSWSNPILNKKPKKTFAENFRIMAIGIAIIAGSLFLLSKIPEEELKKSLITFGIIVGGISALIISMGKLPVGKSENIIIFGNTMIKIGVALLLFAAAIKVINSFKGPELAKGLSVIAGFVAGFVIVSQLVGKTGAGAGAAFVGLAVALLIIIPAIKAFAMMKWATIAKGGGVLVAFMYAMAGAAKLAGGFQGAGAAASFLAMAAAISVITPSIQLLGMMKGEKVAQGVAAIIATVVGVAAAVRIANKNISKDGGAAFAGLSAVIAAIAAALTVLSFIPFGRLAKAVAALDLTLLSVAEMLKHIKMDTGAIKNAVMIGIVIGSITASLYVLSTLDTATTIANAAVLNGTLAVIALVFKTLRGIRASQVAKQALAIGLILGELVAAFWVLDKLDIHSTIENAVSMSVVLIAVAASIKILQNVPITGALTAVANFALFFSGMLVLALILGKLSEKFEGMKGTLEKGIEIAGLVGRFLGAIIGGVLAEISGVIFDSIESAADSLSNFADKIQPFVEAMRGIDDSVLQGASNLAKAILELTAADFLSGLESMVSRVFSFITGDFKSGADPYGQMVDQFTALGEAINTISEVTSGLSDDDISRLDMIANAVEPFARIGGQLSNQGGLIQGITGSRDMGQFGEQIAGLIKSMNDVLEEASSFDSSTADSFKNIAAAIRPFVGITNSLGTNTKSFKSRIMGNTDISKFGKQIKDLVLSMALASEAALAFASLGPKVPIAFTTVAASVTPFLSISKKLETNTRSFKSKIMGNKDLSKFGEQVADLVEAMCLVAPELTSVTPAMAVKFTILAAVAAPFVNISKSLPSNTISLKSSIFGSADIGEFGQQIHDLAVAIGTAVTGATFIKGESITKFTALQETIPPFVAIVQELNKADGIFGNSMPDLAGFGESITAFIAQIKVAANVATGLTEDKIAQMIIALDAVKQAREIIATYQASDGVDLYGIGDALTIFAGKVQVFVGNLVGIDTATLLANADAINSAIQKIAEAAASTDQITTAFGEAGAQAVVAFATGFGNNIGQAALLADDVVSMLVNTIASHNGDFTNAANSIADALLKTLKGKMQDMMKLGQDMATKYAKGITSKVNTASSAGRSLALAAISGARNISIYTQFYNLGKYAADGFKAGINVKAKDVAKAAAQMVTDAIKAAANAQQSHSPSKKFMKLGNYGGEGYAIGFEEKKRYIQNSVASTIVLAMAAAQKIAENESVNPVITPVLDMSNVRSGLGDVSTMFGSTNYALSGISGAMQAASLMAQNQKQTYNDSNVIGAINSLRDDMDLLYTSIANGNIYVRLNDGTVAGRVAGRVDAEIGRRTNIRNRGLN